MTLHCFCLPYSSLMKVKPGIEKHYVISILLPPPDARTNRSVHCIEVFKYEVKHFSTYDVEIN